MKQSADPGTPLQRRVRSAAAFQPVRERDLVYLALPDGTLLVVACDSDGGIGPKPRDVVPCSGYQLGRFAARVPLLELLAAGATPVLVADTLAVEMEPSGAEILRGILDEAALAGVGPDAVTGSTEDNVPTVMTGVGVTVLGTATAERLRAGSARDGAAVLLVGRPKAGPEENFPLDDPEILHLPALRALLGVPEILDIVPVGSHGVAHECMTLAASAGLEFRATGSWPVASEKSGGPGTACVAAVALPALDSSDAVAFVERIAAAVDRPVWLIGSVHGRGGAMDA
ncbi:MAG: AIR synthase related protein [Egibacteraceae bacterium]